MVKLFPRIDRSDVSSASLGILEFMNLNFTPKRIYWMTDFVFGTTRGNHAHKTLQQIFIVIRGELSIELTNGSSSQKYRLSSESGYLSIESGLWRVISDAQPGTVLLVLADQPYDEDDYIRDWDEFLNWRKSIG